MSKVWGSVRPSSVLPGLLWVVVTPLITIRMVMAKSENAKTSLSAAAS